MRCIKHLEENCGECPKIGGDNIGSVSIGANTGDVNVGIGSGVSIDLSTGDLGVQVAPGVSIDF